MRITKAEKADLHFIQTIAEKTWPVVYAKILSPEQIRYMLDKMYALHALEEQMQKGHEFILASLGNDKTGFASYELNYDNKLSAKLHKLYVLPEMHKKNIGKALLNEVVNAAKAANQKSLILNVNRNNEAVDFYSKQGFEIIKEEDLDIGNGYFMNDFVMALKL